MNILVVDDEELIREVIKEYLVKENYNVIEASNGEEAILKALENDIDLMIMDIMMPKLDGFSAVKEIKKKKDIKTIFLSARSEEFDKLMGFEIGSDDYVTKPFSPRELMARVKAVLKRDNKNLEFYTYKDLSLSLSEHALYIDKKEVKITPKEFELLTFFINNINIALSRETILNNVWGYDFFGDARTVDTHVKMLRNNLGKYRDLIVTSRGVGYKFVQK